MRSLFALFVGFLAVLLLFPAASMAQGIGQVSAVTQGATLKGASGTVTLQRGARLSSGDVIMTDGTGRAELLFDDETKVVVGPASKLVIDEVLMQSPKKAQRFAIAAVNGSFRFITGNSPKPAYDISTPTATMAIRGTIFDFAVSPKKGTNVALFRGKVRLCTSGACANMQGDCTVAVSNRRGKIAAPKTTDERDIVLIDDFPLVINQDDITPKFRAPVGGCGDLQAKVAAVRKVAAPAPAFGTLAPRQEGANSRPERSTSAPEQHETPSAPDPEPSKPDPEPEAPAPPSD